MVCEGEGFAEVGFSGAFEGPIAFRRTMASKAVAASWCHGPFSVPSGGILHDCPSLEVHGGECQVDRGSVSGKASISGACKSVDVLQERKEWLDRCAPLDDDLVAHDRPRTHRPPAIAPAHDAVANAFGFQQRPAGIAVVALVSIESSLVATDQAVPT